jgi:hypothetical protein
MTTAKTATPRKRATRKPAAPKGVNLARTTPKTSTALTTNYAPFARALWNLGEAAETATTLDKSTGEEIPSESARRYYARKRDELLATL